MKTKLLLLVTLLGAAGLFGGADLGAVDQSVNDALLHTREAITAGQAGQGAGVADHAQQALNALSGRTDPRSMEAARHLQEAIAAGRAGDASSGALHATQAQSQLQGLGG
ncbi:MAG: hypothetical protein HY900_27910 [Deltaproteobacteria bacterium]|nr:hypothetical protein [Deltaproteobacteria bacterium]